MNLSIYVELLLLVHAYMTWMMIGIIFFVQVVYLPLYRRLKTQLSEYEKKDLIHMGYLVGPIHFFESLTAIILVFTFKENRLYQIFALINVSLIFLIWLVNWGLRLRKKRKEWVFVRRMHDILLSSNWFKTICWSFRGWAVLMMILFSNVEF